MGSDEKYKLQWSETVRDHCWISVYANRPLLRTHYVISHKIKPWIKMRMPWTVVVRQRLTDRLSRRG